MTESLLDSLKRRPLLADGAMGTQLMLAGLESGQCGEEWNLTRPDVVREIQRRYVEAGSDCLLTNTFGASRIALDRHGAGDKTAAINAAGVTIAREAFQSTGSDGYVIGDIGPFGGMLEPYGDFTEAQVRDAFAQQACALVDAGVNAIIIETQTSLEELAIGLDAAKGAGAACVIGSMAFDVSSDGSTYRTMMGVDPETAARHMLDRGADLLALNCGAGMDILHAGNVVRTYRRFTDRPIMAQPNAGTPRLIHGRLSYDQSPQSMCQGVRPLLTAGCNLIGGCCGTGPEHIRAIRREMDDWTEQARNG